MRFICLALVAGCFTGSPPRGGLPAGPVHRLPAPPPGCRPLVVRPMPTPSIVHAWVPETIQTTILVAADRMVVFQTEEGVPERGEMFDPATNAWIPIASANAPRYASSKDGPGPMSGQHYVAFDDYVVVTWFDGNHHTRFSGAVFDARANRWHAMSTAGMPPNLGDDAEAGTAGFYVRLPKDGSAGHRYDIHRDRWSAIPKAGAQRTSPAIGAYDGKVAVWGGILGEPHGTGEILDLATNTWKPMATAGAPSGRLVAWSVSRDGLLVTWSGVSAAGHTPELADGGIYDIAADRWSPIDARNAPDPDRNVADVFLRWTGEALLALSLPHGAPTNADPRELALWDPQLGGWWRGGVTTSWSVLPLGFGRVLVVDPSPRIVHARDKLQCPVSLAMPVFANGPDAIAAKVMIGDELVLWGRSDSTSPPPCPAGAPCARFRPTFTSVDEGVVVTP